MMTPVLTASMAEGANKRDRAIAVSLQETVIRFWHGYTNDESAMVQSSLLAYAMHPSRSTAALGVPWLSFNQIVGIPT